MKILKIAALCFISFNLHAAWDYNKAKDELVNAANIFAVDNLLEKGISEANMHKWRVTMNNIDDYINDQLNKQRSFGQGISDANKTIIKNAAINLRPIGDEIFTNLTIARNENFNFAPEKYREIAPKFQGMNDIIVAFIKSKLPGLEALRKNLKPGFTDILDVKNMKEILDKKALIYEEVLKNILQHVSALSNKVTVGAMLEEQKARGSAGKQLKK